MGPPNQIKLNWERLKQYDTDVIEGFSPTELEKMPFLDAACVFQYGPKESGISYDDAAKFLREISPSKQARIIDAIDRDARIEYFKRMAKFSLNNAYQILQNLKEGPFDVILTGPGLGAYFLLKYLPKNQRMELERRLQKEDPSYYSAIASQAKKIEGWGKGGGDIKSLSKESDASTVEIQPKTDRKRDTVGDKPSAIEVLQHQYAISKSGYLQSYGAGPCVIVTLYDSKSKTGALVHIDSMTEIENTFDKIICEMKEVGANINNLEARIIGGAKGQSEEMLWVIKDRLSESKIKIVEEDTLRFFDNGERASVQLDLRNGEVSDYEEAIYGTPADEFDAYIKKISKEEEKSIANRHKSSL